MFTITINGNTLTELLANTEIFLQANRGQQAQPMQPMQPMQQPNQNFTIPPASPSPVPQQPPIPPIPQQQPASSSSQTLPTADGSQPIYKLDQLLEAGKGLADAGKLDQARNILTSWGYDSVYNLPAEYYPAMAAELRALGARI